MLKKCVILFLLLIIFGSVCLAEEMELPVELGFSVSSDNMYPKLAENFKTQLEIAMETNSGHFEGLNMSLNVWVISVEGGLDTIEKNLPDGTSTDSITKKDLGEGLLELVDNFGDSLDEAWGEDWSVRAEEAAKIFYGIETVTRNYTYSLSPVHFYSIRVMSPCLDPRTFQLYEGTFLIILEISMDMDFEMDKD